MRTGRIWSRWVETFLCAVVVVFAPGLALAQASGESPPDAKAILLGMAEFLGKAQRMSVTVRGAYDATQASGQKIEWNEIRTVTLSRPDRLRMEAEKSNGARSLVIFDGKEIFTYDESGKVYGQAPQPGGVDEALMYFVSDLGIRLPLAVLFFSRAATQMKNRVRSVAYVEKTGIFGAPAHHIAGRTDTVDFQVWITDGDRPVPQRVVLAYRTAPGHPEFTAQFGEWNLTAEPADSLFTFTPPADASRIPFATAMPLLAVGSKVGPAKSAVKKGATQ